mmetsp:Transcript_8508/g.12383  ORF Transcript_8508/g.12383 Transcript_8508/m.12383 type:complete len:973 (+) Transcript_8508:76-2994(+)|eukprot:CAMPEP_0195512048 /NCGR_PEP_ID=MMETSP0794_2-20130614/4150_1 /TAXON_ID=515487 /ORGANISM="Stephanopyxis turris, Strain CCMP 815" /LENGTH=972 /DNA_ID=CAMNT_0040639767 /DNA_START=73 /DNA_END=2991 /DNA_ORIENTATION=+
MHAREPGSDYHAFRPPLPRNVDSEHQSYVFDDDEPREMTNGRRIARMLMKFGWYYNPEKVELKESKSRGSIQLPLKEEYAAIIEGAGSRQREEVEVTRPSLDKAWAYFEHVTLPRHLIANPYSSEPGESSVSTKCCAKAEQLDRAEPGESIAPTKMYSPFSTPLSQMGDFGIGVGLYFSMLRALWVICLLAGLINVPNIMYFASEKYSANGQMSVTMLLRGSALCTTQVYVPCPECSLEDFAHAPDRLGTSNDLMFALKNQCDGATFKQGMVNLCTLFFVLIATIILVVYQKNKVVEFDEDEQTCQDYSIVVNNPPVDAHDPEEWKDFFAKFNGAHVTCCTVTVENDELLDLLVKRRELRRKLQEKLPTGTFMDDSHLTRIAQMVRANASTCSKLMDCFRKLGLFLDIPTMYENNVVLTNRIRELSGKEYSSTKVFVTFETEAAQRYVLSKLCLGKLKVWRNDTHSLDSYLMFRGKHILDVEEPAEPGAIRWHNLDESFKDQVKSLSVTTFVTLCALLVFEIAVFFCEAVNAVAAGFMIAFFNVFFPVFAKVMTNYEIHGDEGDVQRSFYIKIAIFRWVNTAIIVTLTSPHTSTITPGKEHLLATVYAVFFADIVTSQGTKLLDIGGNIKRHFVAPRSPDQERMNQQFQGAAYDLAERYTNATKLLFLCFYYSAIYPGALFFSSVAIFITFYVDKFALMRTWAQASKLGSEISDFSQKYFFPLTVCAFAYFSSYAWSGFPYDNICDTGNAASGNYIGSHVIHPIDDATASGDRVQLTVNVTATDPVYAYCNQNLLLKEGAFPALSKYQYPDKWMTEEQELVTDIYGWTSVAFLAGTALLFLFLAIGEFKKMFFGGHDPTGDDMNIKYSDVQSMDSYIPQVKSTLFNYPLIGCKTDNIDDSLFSWRDPDKPYDFYNLTKDAEDILGRPPPNKAFSVIKHWPPGEDVENENEDYGNKSLLSYDQLRKMIDSLKS